MGLEQRQVPCPRNVDEAQNNRDRELSLSSGSVGLGMPRDAPEPLQAGRRTLSERRRFVMPGAWGCIHLAYATGQSVGDEAS